MIRTRRGGTAPGAVPPAAGRRPGGRGGRGGRGRRGGPALALAAALAALAAACGPPPAPPRRPGPPLSAVVPPCHRVSVFPSPGTPTASATTQISFRGRAFARLERSPVSVIGSRTGRHRGRWVADSDGQGGSLFPTRPFAAGETVTVLTGFALCGASRDRDQFQVAVPPAGLRLFRTSTAAGPATGLQHFRSAPGLQPPRVAVSRSGHSAPGDLLLAPKEGDGSGGPMILGPNGHLIWFDPLPGGTKATNLRVQRLQGAPVLTWWQGQVVSGHGRGEDLIANRHYRVVATVRAGNGYAADLHEFLLRGRDTAWITAFSPVARDLSQVGGPADGAVWDGIVEAIDIPTGNVLFEWHSLGHVGPSAAYPPLPTVAGAPYDYFHVNGISPQPGGTVLISSRNTDSAYEVSQATGRVLWRLGGRSSSLRMEGGTFFRLQHDVEWRGNGLVSVFDDEDQSPRRLPARALLLRVHLRLRTVTLVGAYGHAPPLLDSAQGNVQILPDGHLLIGWGSQPATTEVSRSGRVVMTATLSAGNSYRAYRGRWTGLPPGPPQLAVGTRGGGGVTAYASWNGATEVHRWELLAGSSPTALAAVRSWRRRGFETGLPVPVAAAYVAVRAETSTGTVLGTSAAVSTAGAGG